MWDRLLWVSRTLGWGYTICWCLSFHPQAWKNYHRQSVSGVSLDFLFSNVAGFIAYSVYNVALFFSHRLRQQYALRHGGKEPGIQPNDLVFPLYALLLASFTLGQAFYYPREEGQRLSRLIYLSLWAYAVLSIACLCMVGLGWIEWLDLLEVVVAIKLIISAYKYAPQVWENYRRQSTKAWAIWQILLDAAGGVLSIAQLFVDAARLHDPGSIGGSGLPKLLLALLACGFDATFILQHYVFYRDPPEEKTDEEGSRLLDADDLDVAA